MNAVHLGLALGRGGPAPAPPVSSFPQVAGPITQQFSTAGTSHGVTMPATVNAGDLLMTVFCWYASAGATTATIPSGWTSKLNTTLNSVGLAVAIKVADGTEDSSSQNWTLSVSAAACAITFRITDWFGTTAGVEAAIANTGIVTSLDTPSLSPSWGSAKTLWLAVVGAADDNATVSVYPTNYTTNTSYVNAGAANNSSCETAVGWRELEAASDDPGSFTLSEAESVITTLVAVRPA